ncbi:hypothetical protein FHK02_5220 [Spirosoma sp. LMG 31448]|nr:hypothetical protein [Spirosoma utsteinense]
MLVNHDLKVIANVCIMHPLGAFAGSYKIRHLAISQQEGYYIAETDQVALR